MTVALVVLLASAAVVLFSGSAQALVSPTCNGTAVAWPGGVTYDSDLAAAYQAICAASDSDVATLVKDTGTAESALVGDTTAAATAAESEMWAVRIAAGALPALSTISAVGAAGFLGWKIGRAIDTKWLHLTPTGDDPIPDAVIVPNLQWLNLTSPGEAKGSGRFITNCLAYIPATSCGATANVDTTPDLFGGPLATGDKLGAGQVWVLSTSASSSTADLGFGFTGLTACLSVGLPSCSQAVIDTRTAYASSMPRVDVETVPSVQTQNWSCGGGHPNCDAPWYGTFVYRTGAQMEKHWRADLEPYTGQPFTQSTTMALPADSTIAANGRSSLLQSGHEHAARTIGNAIDPTNVPPATRVRVPDCDGLDYYGCVTALRQAGLVGNIIRNTLSFGAAVITAGPNGVVKTSPTLGTLISTTDDVTLTVNPGVAGMPILVPQVDAGTSLEDAAQQLQAVHLHPVFNVLSTPNANYGPSVVTSAITTPQAHTRAHYQDDVQVEVNPSTAPDLGPGGLFTPPVVPPLELPAVVTPCNVFPLGAVCWIVNQLQVLSASPEAPHFSIGLPFGQTLNVDLANVFGADVTDIMTIVRPILLMMFTVGMMIWLVGAASGSVRAPGGGDAEVETDRD